LGLALLFSPGSFEDFGDCVLAQPYSRPIGARRRCPRDSGGSSCRRIKMRDDRSTHPRVPEFLDMIGHASNRLVLALVAKNLPI
jgi:hypothetical protein